MKDYLVSKRQSKDSNLSNLIPDSVVLNSILTVPPL